LQSYIEFLIENRYLAESLFFFKKIRPNRSYFHAYSIFKLKTKIEKLIDETDNFNVFTTEYDYVFDYDKKCVYVTEEISNILKLKLGFWREVSKESPSMKVLQKNGCDIV
jgi:hypothetical protein